MRQKPITSPTTILFFPLISLICGIIIQKNLQFSIIYTLVATILTLTCFFIVLILKKQLFSLILASMIFFLAAGAFLLSYQITTHQIKQKKLSSQKISFTALVTDKKHHLKRGYKERLTLQKENSTHRLLCYLTKPTNIIPGNVVTITSVVLLIPKNEKTIADNPTFFDYLVKENIIATIYIKTQKKISHHLDNKENESLSRRFQKWYLEKRHTIFRSLQEKIPPQPLNYFSTIFLGNKNATPYHAPQHQFLYWGINHLLARSGLHIALFILLWSIILSIIPIHIIAKNLILTTICTLYSMLSWTSTSFTRAIGLFLLYQVGTILNKQTNLLYLLQLIALTTLIVNPMQLFFLDFQLSFSISAALIWAFSSKQNPKKDPRLNGKTLIPCPSLKKYSNMK